MGATKAPPWFRVDRRIVQCLPDLGSAALRVYLKLAAMADFDAGTCFPKVETIAEAIGMSRRSVQIGLRELERLGLVRTQGQHANSGLSIANLYGLPMAPGERAQSTAPHGASYCAPGAQKVSPQERSPVRPRNESQQNQNQQNESQQPNGREAAGVVPIPAELECEEFHAAWCEWTAYRRERRLTLTGRTLQAQLEKLAKWGVADAVRAIRESIANGWQGIFPPKANGQRMTAPAGMSEREARGVEATRLWLEECL